MIGRLIELQRCCVLVPLLGNHEIMWRESLHSRRERSAWLNCGGQATVRSYGETAAGLPDLPAAHQGFLQDGLVNYWETETHLFAHTFVDSSRELAEQPPWLLFWEPFAGVQPHRSGKILVCGHSR